MYPELSVVIPVYNVQDYLQECIESVITNQRNNFLEIILVNDGSTDNSVNICKKYDEKYSFIKIINQKNKGLSAARNAGLRMATGKYIIFIDSDDYLCNSNSLIEMKELLDMYNTDMCIGGVIEVHENEQKQLNMGLISNLRASVKSLTFFGRCLENDICYAPVWMYMYRRQMLIENNLYFKEGILHEDEEFTPRVFVAAKEIAIYKENFYAYRIREGSITRDKLNKKRGVDLIETCTTLVKKIEINNNNIKKLFIRRMVALCQGSIFSYNINSISHETKIMLIFHSYDIKVFIKSLLIYISPEVYNWILKFFFNLRGFKNKDRIES